MRIDMVHPQGIPPAAAGCQDRTPTVLCLNIAGSGQLTNLKGPYLSTVVRRAVLRKPNYLVHGNHHSACGPGVVFVSLNDRALRMWDPRSRQVFSEVQAKPVMLIGSRTRKQPPAVFKAEDRRVGVTSLNQRTRVRPVRRKGLRYVQANGARL